MNKFKPGELWAKHQEKMKKKHEKHQKKHKGVADQPSMRGFNPSARTTTPDTKFTGIGNLPKQSVAKPVTRSTSGLVGVGNGKLSANASSTKMMAKRKHSKHRKHMKKLPSLTTKHSGKFEGKSNALGRGGRAAQLKARGVPGGVIGDMARAAHAAPGQANYHGKHKKHEKKEHKHEKHHKMGKHCKTCSCE